MLRMFSSGEVIIRLKYRMSEQGARLQRSENCTAGLREAWYFIVILKCPSFRRKTLFIWSTRSPHGDIIEYSYKMPKDYFPSLDKVDPHGAEHVANNKS